MGGIKQSKLFRRILKNGFWDEDMGLDQYAYIAARKNQRADYWDSVVPRKDTSLGELHYENPGVPEPVEIAYWRKHPNLQGWMEQLFANKGGECDIFNGVEVELTWADIDQLEQDILAGRLPPTQGGIDNFIEVGPGRVLQGLTKESIEKLKLSVLKHMKT